MTSKAVHANSLRSEANGIVHIPTGTVFRHNLYDPRDRVQKHQGVGRAGARRRFFQQVQSMAGSVVA